MPYSGGGSGGGGGGGDVTAIKTGTLAADAANIDITGISALFSVLQFDLLVRGAYATVNLDAELTLNGDTGANYRNTAYSFLQSGTTTHSGSDADSYGIMKALNGNSAITSAFSALSVRIPFYSNTATYKSAVWTSNAGWNIGGDACSFGEFIWMSTAAVTEVTFTFTTGNVLAGSSYVLYGYK